MDLSNTIQANSQQINADDLTGAPRTVTITSVEAGTTEQPVFIHVAEFPGRTYRPGKSMRRVLVYAWGKEATDYIGRRLTLFNDETIRFGKDITGGIRISHMSHIDKVLTIPLTVTRGRRAPFTVQPLTTPAPNATLAVNAITSAKDVAELTKLEKLARERGIQDNPAVKAAIDKKREELT